MRIAVPDVVGVGLDGALAANVMHTVVLDNPTSRDLPRRPISSQAGLTIPACRHVFHCVPVDDDAVWPSQRSIQYESVCLCGSRRC